MLDDEIERGEVGRRIIHVVDIERVTAQRVDGGSLMDVNILDAKFLAELKIFVGPGIVQPPAFRALPPFGGVELEPRNRILLDHVAERLQPGLFRPRVKGAVEEKTIWVLLLERVVLVVGVKPVCVKLIEIGRVENANVDIPLDEEIVNQRGLAILTELFIGPFRVRRAQATMVRIEAVNPVFAMGGNLVRRTGVPQMHVAIDHKDVLPVVRVHGASPLSRRFLAITAVTPLSLDARERPKEYQLMRLGLTRGEHRTTQGAVRLEGEPHRARACHMLLQPLYGQRLVLQVGDKRPRRRAIETEFGPTLQIVARRVRWPHLDGLPASAAHQAGVADEGEIPDAQGADVRRCQASVFETAQQALLPADKTFP